MPDEEPVLSAENAAELLSLKPTQEAPDEPNSEGDVSLAESPEPDVPEISDTNDNVNQELKEAVERQEQRDANLWAAGVPPARTAAKQRADERAFIEQIHKPPEDAA